MAVQVFIKFSSIRFIKIYSASLKFSCTVIIEHFYWCSSGLLMFLKMTLFLDTEGLFI